MKAPRVTMVILKTSSPCQLGKKKLKLKQFKEKPVQSLHRSNPQPHLAVRTSVSDSLACIKHKPVELKQEADVSAGQESCSSNLDCAALPGKTKMKQAASPPISEITRPMSGVKSARTSVTTNHTSVCRIRLLRSRRTHTSTCSPRKRSQSPSMTALQGRSQDHMSIKTLFI